MAVFKIDYTVAHCLSNDRDEFIAAMKMSSKMYSWHREEDVENTVESFAVANPRATLGQMIEWTKKTYMDRLTAHKEGRKYTAFRINTNEVAPAKPIVEQEGRRVAVIDDAIPARPKQRTDLKKVAEPGQEAEVDAADANALEGEKVPDLDLNELPATDPSLGKSDPVDPPYVPGSPAAKYAEGTKPSDQAQTQSPLAAKLAAAQKK